MVTKSELCPKMIQIIKRKGRVGIWTMLNCRLQQIFIFAADRNTIPKSCTYSSN